MRLAALLVLPGLLAAGPVLAGDLVATRPGLMCVSSSALARLTLPDGSSRAATAPRPGDLDAKAEGGCIDIPAGARVTVLRQFRNTAIVTYDGEDGGYRVYVVPVIDFRPAEDAPPAAPPDLPVIEASRPPAPPPVAAAPPALPPTLPPQLLEPAPSSPPSGSFTDGNGPISLAPPSSRVP